MFQIFVVGKLFDELSSELESSFQIKRNFNSKEPQIYKNLLHIFWEQLQRNLKSKGFSKAFVYSKCESVENQFFKDDSDFSVHLNFKFIEALNSTEYVYQSMSVYSFYYLFSLFTALNRQFCKNDKIKFRRKTRGIMISF